MHVLLFAQLKIHTYHNTRNRPDQYRSLALLSLLSIYSFVVVVVEWNCELFCVCRSVISTHAGKQSESVTEQSHNGKKKERTENGKVSIRIIRFQQSLLYGILIILVIFSTIVIKGHQVNIQFVCLLIHFPSLQPIRTKHPKISFLHIKFPSNIKIRNRSFSQHQNVILIQQNTLIRIDKYVGLSTTKCAVPTLNQIQLFEYGYLR